MSEMKPKIEGTVIVLANGTTTFYNVSGVKLATGWDRSLHGWRIAGTTESLPISNRWLVDDHGIDTGGAAVVRPLEAIHPSGMITTGYQLRNPEAESSAFPAELTSAEYLRRRDRDEDLAEALYEGVLAVGDPTIITIPAEDMLVLSTDAQPAPDHPGVWRANVPTCITTHKMLHHQLSGRLEGLADAAHKRIEVWLSRHSAGHAPRSIFGSSRVIKEAAGTGFTRFTVKVWAPFTPERTVQKPRYGVNGQKLKTATAVVDGRDLTVVVTFPDHVAGGNLADALVAWNQHLDSLDELLNEALTPAVCGHCNGSGIIPRSQTRQS